MTLWTAERLQGETSSAAGERGPQKAHGPWVKMRARLAARGPADSPIEGLINHAIRQDLAQGEGQLRLPGTGVPRLGHKLGERPLRGDSGIRVGAEA